MNDKNEMTGEELIYRARQASDAPRHCECGLPIQGSPCSQCGGYAFDPGEILLGFMDGSNLKIDTPLMKSLAIFALTVPSLADEINDLNKRMDDLERSNSIGWWAWLMRIVSIAGLLDWLGKILGPLLGILARRKGKHAPDSAKSGST